MSDRALILAGIGATLGLALIGYVALRKAGQLAPGLIPYIDPTSDKNLVYQGANAVFNTPSIGGAIYDFFHSDPLATPATAADIAGSVMNNGIPQP